mmetsp:Transcript_46872/g.34303  ORF Transcript_46872/g.34303 Transcript_46872/m.34303 type:complete len:141 (-) Transcript_46872:1479-1901(-)
MHQRLAKRLSSLTELPKHSYEFTVLKRVLTYQEGSGFGELALMSKKPAKRAATIVCDEEVLLATLHKDPFNESIKEALARKLDLRVQFLLNFRLAEGITKKTLEKLTQYLKEKNYRWRDTLYKEGDHADGVYFVRDGEFE